MKDETTKTSTSEEEESTKNDALNKHMQIFKNAITTAQLELSAQDFYTLFQLNHGAMKIMTDLSDLDQAVKAEIDSTVSVHAEVATIETIKEALGIEDVDPETEAKVAGISTESMDTVITPVREMLDKAMEELNAPEFFVVIKVLQGALELYLTELDMPDEFESAISSMVSITTDVTTRNLEDLGIKLPDGIAGGMILASGRNLEDIPPEIIEAIKSDLGDLAEQVFPTDGDTNMEAVDGIINHIIEGSEDCEDCPKKKKCEKMRALLSGGLKTKFKEVKVNLDLGPEYLGVKLPAVDPDDDTSYN